MKPIYKRILLKLSGEGLMGDKSFGVSSEVVASLAKQIKDIKDLGVDICVVVGGGNIFRGAQEASKGLNRSVADQVGMMATIMNALYIQDALEKNNIKAKVISGLRVPQVCESYVYRRAINYLNQGYVLIFAGGTGSPYFTTDSGAALRASEMGCDAILKATQVDGVYSADPKKDSTAERYEAISYDDVIQKGLKVMDLTAVSMAKENDIPIVVFSQHEQNAIKNTLCGKGVFTIIK